MHCRVLFLFIFYFCGCWAEEDLSASFATTGTVDASAFIGEGDSLLKAKRYPEALTAFSKAIKLDDTNFNTYYKRAGIYLLRGQNKNGLADLNLVLEKNPSFLQARLRRGKVHLTLGNFWEAEQDFNQVLFEKPDSELAKKQLADVKKCSHDMEAASAALGSSSSEETIRLIGKVLEIATDSKAARLTRAQISLKAKQYHSILEDTMVVIKQDSKNLEALFLRGQAFYYLGEHEAAIKHYREALKFDPEHTNSKSEFKRLNKLEKAQVSAEENFRQNKYQDALKDYSTALLLEPNNELVTPKLFLGKCKSYVSLKQIADAITACTDALSHDGTLIDAYLQRAEAHVLANEYDKALHDFHKVREFQPQSQQANEGIHRVQRLQKMAKRKDYYKILDIDKSASDIEIRKAYRKLAKIWHPDKIDNEVKEDAEKQYVDIAEAYEVLSNEEARRRYDNGEDIDVQPNFSHGPFGGGQPFHFTFNFGG